jgi:drug/metabolite transporter (DMT)-like permease
MNPAILFAFLSLFFAGINDVVFKKYSQKKRSRGMNVLGIGVIWSLCQVTTLFIRDTPFVLDGVSMGFGLGAGLFLTLSNLMLLESFSHINVGLGATIYRLNTIVVVIFSFFLLEEPFGGIKFIGIVCGIMAVILLYKPDPDLSMDRSVFLFFGWLAILAACLRGGYGVISKAGLLHQANPETMLLLISTSWILGGGIYAVFREKTFRISARMAGYSGLSGVLAFLIVNFLMLALAHGEASIVIPIANMSFVVSLGISAFLHLERVSFRKVVAMGWAGISIFLLAQV